MAFNPVTALSVFAGGANVTGSGPGANHIVVYDMAEPPNAIPPSQITWDLSKGPAGLVETADATGFFFTDPSVPATPAGDVVATWSNNDETGTLTVTIVVKPMLQFSLE